jgi:hypothetical protein
MPRIATFRYTTPALGNLLAVSGDHHEVAGLVDAKGGHERTHSTMNMPATNSPTRMIASMSCRGSRRRSQ